MLKTTTLLLPGRDAFRPYGSPYRQPRPAPVTLTELPALVADRYARLALAAVDAPLDGGVVALALEYLPDVLRLGERAQSLLDPFVQASRPARQWTNVLALQQAALALHAGFIVSRPQLDIPVTLQAESIKRGAGELSVTFCSPPLATVLHSGRASYRELETVLGTEDVYNLVELINVETVRDWRASQTTT